MMKKPTTRKLSEAKVLLAKDKDGNPFKKLFPDEKFYQYPNYPKIFVSQYANVISTNQNRYIWRTPYYNAETGYSTLVLTKRGKRECKGIHELVAEVWLEKPSFVLQDELEVHHQIKVKENLQCQPINLNFAENLCYVYRKYHHMLDQNNSMKYKYKNKWHEAAEPIEIAQAYGVSEYSIYELLLHEPQDIKKKDKFYKQDKIFIKVR